MLKSKESEIKQPLLLAILVTELAIDSTERRIQAGDWRLNELEETVGQHEYINRPKRDPLDMDFVGTTRTLNTTSRMLGVERMRLGACLLALDLIERETMKLSINHIDSTKIREKIDKEMDDEGALTLIELTEYQINVCQNLVLRVEYQEKRVQSQIAVVSPSSYFIPLQLTKARSTNS